MLNEMRVFSFVVLDLNMPQETEICPTAMIIGFFKPIIPLL